MTQEYLNELLLVVDFMDAAIEQAADGSEYAVNMLEGAYANQYGYVLERYDMSFVTMKDLSVAAKFVPQKVARIIEFAESNAAFAAALED